MKNLTNSKARANGKRDLRRVFRDCKFKDALTLGEDAATPDDFIYYYNKARDGQVGNYIVYEVISTDANTRADDSIIGREFYAQVDVFSVKSFESKSLQDTLAKLEEKLTAAGFEVTMDGEDYEPDTRLYHQVIYAAKLYF
jgi:hypothetical protein